MEPQEQWTAVDQYITELLVSPDAAVTAALESSAAAGLPAISVSPPHGQLLQVLAKSVGARRILEIGTLGGYSTIWLARALPSGGRVISLELLPKHAEVARANIARAGCADRVEIRVGAALDLLPALVTDPPFDLTFIDADKQNIPGYFRWALRLARPGGLIVVDNVVRGGAVIDAASEDTNVQGVRRFNELLRTERGVSATTIQTVGSKGYDGFTIAVVNIAGG
jgi:predicted O-methyltransferase YrrM